MKKLNRALAIVLAFVMMQSLLPVSVFADNGTSAREGYELICDLEHEHIDDCYRPIENKQGETTPDNAGDNSTSGNDNNDNNSSGDGDLDAQGLDDNDDNDAPAHTVTFKPAQENVQIAVYNGDDLVERNEDDSYTLASGEYKYVASLEGFVSA